MIVERERKRSAVNNLMVCIILVFFVVSPSKLKFKQLLLLKTPQIDIVGLSKSQVVVVVVEELW
jgi:hypothetical protein